MKVANRKYKERDLVFDIDQAVQIGKRDYEYSLKFIEIFRILEHPDGILHHCFSILIVLIKKYLPWS